MINKVTIKQPEKIEIYNLEILSLEQFLNHNYNSESFGWCDGYLIKYGFFSDETFDKGIMGEGIWRYKSVDIAPMPEFQSELQLRFTKSPVFDQTGSQIGHAVIEYIRKFSSKEKSE